jgi:hypothetical protein
MAVRLPRGFCKGCGGKVPKKRVRCDDCNVGRRLKYGNKKQSVNTPGGVVVIDSGKEAKRKATLCILERCGKIRDLAFQVDIDLVVNGVLVCQYRADAVYWEEANGAWVKVVEDTKGFRTPEYKLKAKLFAAIFGHRIREV